MRKRSADQWQKLRQLAVEVYFSQDLQDVKIARRLRVCRQTIAAWRRRFKGDQSKAHLRIIRPGRRGVFGQRMQNIAREIAEKSPKQFGLPGEYWTIRKFSEYFATVHARQLSRSQMYRLLCAHGIKWRNRGRDEG